jgi:hypothetical protein
LTTFSISKPIAEIPKPSKNLIQRWNLTKFDFSATFPKGKIQSSRGYRKPHLYLVSSNKIETFIKTDKYQFHMDTKIEISDVVQEANPLLYTVGRGLKKAGKFLYQTIKQSPDADLFLVGAIGSSFTNDIEGMHILLGLLSVKQYIWSWWTYNDVQKAIQSRDGEISVEALNRRFSIRKEGPCGYFGARYAINEYQRSLEETLE